MTDTWLLLLLRQEAQKSGLYLPFFKVLFVWGFSFFFFSFLPLVVKQKLFIYLLGNEYHRFTVIA